jgi:DNA polymerase V
MNVDAIWAPDLSTRYKLPVFLGRLPAGFPSPADDYIEGKLDLNRHLIKHPAATFFVRVTGDSMTGAGFIRGLAHRIARWKRLTETWWSLRSMEN